MYRLQSLLPLLALLSGTLAVPLLEPELERRQDASPASSTARIATGVTAVPIAATATGTATGGAAGTSYLSPVPVPASSSRRAVSSVYVATSRSAAAIATSSAASAAGTGYTVRPQPSVSSSPENPCGIPQNVLDEYDYLNAQIALRYGPAPTETVIGNDTDTESADTTKREVGGTITRGARKKQRHNKLANTLQCLHPGPAVQDPNAPSIGLYGGLGVQLLPCEDAYYRWSIKEDGGVVVGNGYRPLWALNAEETAEGGNLTIREVEGASNNQSFTLDDSGKLRLSSNATDEALCVAVDNGGISLQECSNDDKDEEQTFVILLLPRPRPISITSSSGSAYRSAATPAGSLVRSSAAASTPSSVNLAARQVVVTGTGEAATGVTATGIAATSSAAAAVGSGVRSAAASRVQSSVSRAATATATGSSGSGVASGSSPTRTSLPIGCPAGYYW